MTLYELGEDYLRQNEYLKKEIRELSQELKEMRGNNYIAGKRKLLCLYEMSRELRYTANILLHYYDN